MFRLQQTGKMPLVIIDEFAATGLVQHGFSTRSGGVSTGHAASLNFGLRCGDTREHVLQNFTLFCRAIGVDVQKTVFADQVHGKRVCVAKHQDGGTPLFAPSGIGQADALITNVPGLVLCTFHADCMPLFFLDPVQGAIGMTHSGWMGTLENIAAQTVAAMTTEFGTNPQDLLCGIGPSIGPCCFEVGHDVAQQFEVVYGTGFTAHRQKPHLNLWELVRHQLRQAGATDEHIISAGLCTCCHTDTFFSYRGDDRQTGRLIGMISLQ